MKEMASSEKIRLDRRKGGENATGMSCLWEGHKGAVNHITVKL